jgi:hypothetical protein
MGRFILYTIIALILNVVSFLVFSLPIFFNSEALGPAIGSLIFGFVLTIISLIIQTIIGLIFLAKEGKKEIGKAMLLSVGIIFLIGLSVCSRSW